MKHVTLFLNSSEYTEDIFRDTIFLHIPTERNTDKTFYQTLILHKALKRNEYRKLGYCLYWRLLSIKNEGWYYFCNISTCKLEVKNAILCLNMKDFSLLGSVSEERIKKKHEKANDRTINLFRPEVKRSLPSLSTIANRECWIQVALKKAEP